MDIANVNRARTQAGNVNFELDRLYSYYNREVKLNPEIVGLPWVRGVWIYARFTYCHEFG